MGAPKWPPKPPTLGAAPAEPWHPSITRQAPDSPPEGGSNRMKPVTSPPARELFRDVRSVTTRAAWTCRSSARICGSRPPSVRAARSARGGPPSGSRRLVETPEQSPLERSAPCWPTTVWNSSSSVVRPKRSWAARASHTTSTCAIGRTSENLERLATALATLNLTLRGAAELKFRLDAQALALGQNYTFEVDGEYPLDLLGYLEPIGT